MSRERELLEKLHTYLEFSGATGSLIKEIEALLAEPEAEPVGYVSSYAARIIKNGGAWDSYAISQEKWDDSDVEVYLHHSRQPVQLSDDEIFVAGARAGFDIDYECPDSGKYGFRNESGDVEKENMLKFARSVIAAYEEKQK